MQDQETPCHRGVEGSIYSATPRPWWNVVADWVLCWCVRGNREGVGWSSLHGMIEVLGPEYMRKPTPEETVEVQRLFSTRRGLLNIGGAVDGTHVPWQPIEHAVLRHEDVWLLLRVRISPRKHTRRILQEAPPLLPLSTRGTP